MSGSTFGNKFKITTWGESHGKALGVVVDGCPAGLPLTEDDIQVYLNRRRPGFSQFSTPRKESDQVEILSGVFEGKTTGTPISLIVRNTSQRSGDYGDIATYYRPGHADYTFDQKYGFRDYRGGDPADFDADYISKNELNMPDAKSCEAASAYLSDIMAQNDSIGSTVKCIVSGVPAGLGDPVFDKLDANLAKALMSIGAVKAVEIGDGVMASENTGSYDNDGFHIEDGVVNKNSNHAGGILGGISDGSDLLLTCHFKATPSIASTQKTINKSGENIDVSIRGRHDPIIGPRAVVVVESMAAITIVNALFDNMSARMDKLVEFYK